MITHRFRVAALSSTHAALWPLLCNTPACMPGGQSGPSASTPCCWAVTPLAQHHAAGWHPPQASVLGAAGGCRLPRRAQPCFKHATTPTVACFSSCRHMLLRTASVITVSRVLGWYDSMVEGGVQVVPASGCCGCSAIVTAVQSLGNLGPALLTTAVQLQQPPTGGSRGAMTPPGWESDRGPQRCTAARPSCCTCPFLPPTSYHLSSSPHLSAPTCTPSATPVIPLPPPTGTSNPGRASLRTASACGASTT